MGSGRGGERYGLVGRKASSVADAVAALVEELDPDLIGGRDAFDLVEVFTRIGNITSAGLLAAAGKVARTDLWKRSGHPTPAQWLSHVTGVSVADAISMLETAEVVESAPDTREALSKGEVSPRLAKAIGAAEKVDPGAGKRLVEAAAGRSTRETEADARRIVAAASTETPEEKAARHRKVRRFRHGVNDDGMGWGSWLLPIAEHTRAVALIEGEQKAVFEQARTAGLRETTENYSADALCRVLDRAAARGPHPAVSEGRQLGEEGTAAGEDWTFTKVIVKVDLTALDRGHLGPGEVCEVAGQGPIPVGDAWRMIDGGAFVAAVTTRGSEISQVVHLGRRPTALQCTALEFLGDGACTIDGCTSSARMEIDHVVDWAATRRTELRQLAPACGHHHDLKTHHGYRFGPLQPNGKRRLIPPDPNRDGREPDPTRPAVLAVVGGEPPPMPPAQPELGEPAGPPRSDEATPSPSPPPARPAATVQERARAIGRGGQGALFDTG